MPFSCLCSRFPRLLAIRAALVVTVHPLAAQSQPPATGRPVGPQKAQVVTSDPIDSVQLEAAARVQRSMDQIRDREQAELAEPKNKKVEVQEQIRDKYRVARAELYKSAGMADTTFTRIVRQVSLDERARQAFEAMLVRLSSNR